MHPYRGNHRQDEATKAVASSVDMECFAVAALAAYSFELCHFFSTQQTTFGGKWDIRTFIQFYDLDSGDRESRSTQFALFWGKGQTKCERSND